MSSNYNSLKHEDVEDEEPHHLDSNQKKEQFCKKFNF